MNVSSVRKIRGQAGQLIRMPRKIRKGVFGLAGFRRPKVFAIGFNKTGTSSLNQLFATLGYDAYHGPGWRSQGPSSWLLNSRDAFSDGIPLDLDAIDHGFPGSHFILQVRSLEPWLLSRLAHIRRAKARGETAFAPDWDDTEEAVVHWIRQRTQYHALVLRKFADRRLLVIDYTRDAHANEKVASFLGKTVQPSRYWANQVEKAPDQSHLDLISSAFSRLGVTDRQSNILTPSLVQDGENDNLCCDTRELNDSGIWGKGS